jgi:hypothetical protein
MFLLFRRSIARFAVRKRRAPKFSYNRLRRALHPTHRTLFNSPRAGLLAHEAIFARGAFPDIS